MAGSLAPIGSGAYETKPKRNQAEGGVWRHNDGSVASLNNVKRMAQ